MDCNVTYPVERQVELPVEFVSISCMRKDMSTHEFARFTVLCKPVDQHPLIRVLRLDLGHRHVRLGHDPPPPPILADDLADRASPGAEREGAAEAVAELEVVRHTEALVDRGDDVGGSDRVAARLGADLVA